MTDMYAVMGNPIAHSKSPQIHAAFAAQTGQDMSYQALLVAEDGFAEAVDKFRQAGGKGLNITVPFKLQAWQLVNQRSERAEAAGAVNTIKFNDDGSMFADNTDGVGMVRDITINHQMTLRDRNVLMLGAGGAVQGVLLPLLAEKPASLIIANRTASKAVELAQRFADRGNIHGCGFDDLKDQRFDVIINGTAASLQGEVPPLHDNIFTSGALAYDMMYADKPTAFLAWAQQHGAAQCVDGLGMLVEQAAESFTLWRGVRPSTGAVIQALRAQA